MKPSIGHIVHIFVNPATNNGSDVAPAIITRVWTDTMINVKVINDDPANTWKTSITLADDEATARHIVAQRRDTSDLADHQGWLELDTVAYWPPRI